MLTRFVGCLFLFAGLLLVGDSAGQDKKPKAKLPVYWLKLDLTEQQKDTIATIQAKHQPAIADLEKKVAALKPTQKEEKTGLDKELAAVRKQERTEMEKVLTEAQIAKLKDILLDKTPAADKPKDK